MTTTIRFIQESSDYPSFEVDFSRYRKEERQQELSLASKVGYAVVVPIRCIKIFFTCAAKASHTTLSHLGISFRFHVLKGFRFDLAHTIFSVGAFLVSVGWTFMSTTARLLYREMQGETPFLSRLAVFAGDEIDPSHITTKENAIDVRGIPSEVCVDNLRSMFEAINFLSPDQPGYMGVLRRTELKVTYSPEDLKNSLKKFIYNVENRVPFLGTPPAWDVPRLYAFYQQIEDAVCFAIHKSNEDLKAFREEHGSDDYDEDALRRYKNILEDRANIPLRLAIAGKHCGGRYTGEAWELYNTARGSDQSSGCSLRDTLIEVLAAKRKEIALQQIQTRLGANTHDFANYMATFGEILAIPGTANVTEHLADSLDTPVWLGYFFEEYTVDCILDTVQQKIKSSQALREQIIDWLKDQREDWEPTTMVSLQEEKTQAEAILKDETSEIEIAAYQHFLFLKEIIPNVVREEDETWAESLNKAIRSWAGVRYPNNVLQQATVRNAINKLFSEELLGESLSKEVQKVLNGEGGDFSQFIPQLRELDKSLKLCQLTQMNPDTAKRVVKGQKDLEEALKEVRAQRATSDFTEALDLDAIHQGLSPEILEWILVSQGILRAQGGV